MLDPDFNGGLPVVIDYFDDDVPARQAKDDQATGVVLDSAGRIVVSGSGSYRFYVSGDQDDMATLSLRLFADGGLDPTYQSGATSIPGMTVNASSLYNHGQGVAIDGAGRIVVVGYQEYGGTDDPTIYRYLPASGQPDSTFGSGGWTNVPSTGEVQGFAIAIDPVDGNYFVAGSRNGADVQLSKVSAIAGDLVTTFSSGGRLTFDVPGAEQPTDLLVDSSGWLYVCGSYDGPAGTRDLRILRFIGDGTLDPSFDGDGIFTLDLGGAEQANAMALDSDGHLFIAGSTTASSSDLLVVKLVAATGTLDAAFGIGGVFIFNSGRGSSGDVGNDVAIGQDGFVYVAGASVGAAGATKAALWKISHDGALAPRFGGTGDSLWSGLMLPPHAAGGAEDRALALAVDGSAIVMVGESRSRTGFFDLAIWRVR